MNDAWAEEQEKDKTRVGIQRSPHSIPRFRLDQVIQLQVQLVGLQILTDMEPDEMSP